MQANDVARNDASDGLTVTKGTGRTSSRMIYDFMRLRLGIDAQRFMFMRNSIIKPRDIDMADIDSSIPRRRCSLPHKRCFYIRCILDNAQALQPLRNQRIGAGSIALSPMRSLDVAVPPIPRTSCDMRKLGCYLPFVRFGITINVVVVCHMSRTHLL